MLLELTESDLINDFGVKNRLHRERILSAIDAIKTSDDFSDEEDEDEDEDDEEGDESEEDDEDASATQRASRATLGEGKIFTTDLRLTWSCVLIHVGNL